jgi:putative tryptophan/tyrosine transport system substrate-binding protein
MSAKLKRREFITLVGSAAAAWPLAARAQQPAMPVIGVLDFGWPETRTNLVTEFHKGLSETGYIEGRNVAIEFRWAQNDNARLADLAADLVRRQVAVIATTAGTPALAARAATTTIPIVFNTAGDPVQWVSSPASIVRAATSPASPTCTCSLPQNGSGSCTSCCREQRGLPCSSIRTVGMRSPRSRTPRRGLRSLGGNWTSSPSAPAARSILPLQAWPHTFFLDRRAQLLTLAARHALPTIFGFREFVEAGGLMSYGSSLRDQYRQIGIYAGRILKGERPADLPVVQASKFEFVINVQTAKTLGIDVPPTLLALADEVIE